MQMVENPQAKVPKPAASLRNGVVGADPNLQPSSSKDNGFFQDPTPVCGARDNNKNALIWAKPDACTKPTSDLNNTPLTSSEVGG